ncbi:MAG TPA: DUF4265 domain-containing protein [Burkholderiales bacterium]|nr:DUF4265 domain-containing protein [Burkholderiales bacterium]
MSAWEPAPDVAALLANLTGKGDAKEHDAIRALQAHDPDGVPAALLRHYEQSGRAGPRSAAVFFATPYARWSDDAYRLGVRALGDRSKIVKFRAAELLAFSLRPNAVPALRAASEAETDAGTRSHFLAAIDAIEARNHNYFRDREHSGMVSWEIEEIPRGGMVRILFELTPDADGYPPVSAETLWASRLPDGTFEIENTPFYVRGVSFKDAVEAEIADEGPHRFRKLARTAGHTTVRVVLMDPAQMERLTITLEHLGATWESMQSAGLLALDVPPEATYTPIFEFLKSGFDEGTWDFEEAAIRHDV